LRLARKIAESLLPANQALGYLGPLPAIMEKRAGRFRYLLQIDADERATLGPLLSAVATQLENHKDSRRVRWSIDVDPQEL
jgi:primosomal protein N' (replication factor Y) (superfamily II helicase)